MAEEQSHECEDGVLCVCDPSGSLRSQKRKSEGEELAKTKRRCNQKLAGEDDIKSNDYAKSSKQKTKPKASDGDPGAQDQADTASETDAKVHNQYSDLNTDFDVKPEVVGTDVRWKGHNLGTSIKAKDQSAIEELQIINNARFSSDNIDETDRSDRLGNNIHTTNEEQIVPYVSKESKNNTSLDTGIDIKPPDQKKIIRRSLRNLRNATADNRHLDVKHTENSISENKNTVCCNGRNKKQNFSNRLTVSLSALDDDNYNETQSDKCAVETLVKDSVDNGRNHHGKASKVDKNSKLSKRTSSVRLKSETNKEKQNKSGRKTKSANQCIKSKTYKYRSCEDIDSVTKDGGESGKLSIENLKVQVHHARSRRNDAKRLAQSLTENKGLTQSLTESKESEEMDKFERLKMAHSDLDSLGYGCLSEKLNDIERFINDQNDLDKRLTESAVTSKPFKLKSSLPCSRSKKKFTNVHKSVVNTMTTETDPDKNGAKSKVRHKIRHASKISKKNLITSTPKLPNRASRRTQKVKVKKGESVSDSKLDQGAIQEQDESDSLDFSLPTPGPADTHRLPISRSSSSSVPFDCNVDKDMCDSEESDEELPVGLTPIKCEKTFQEKDIVWVKWKNWPYLPAMVKKVYKKKKRVTCLIFRPPEKRENPLPLSTVGNKVWSYFDSDKKEEILKASESLESDMKTLFKECMASVDDYLTKKALGQIDDDLSFFCEDGEELVDSEVDDHTTEESDQPTSTEEIETENDDSVVVTAISEKWGLSKKGKLREEKIREKTQKLTDFLQSTACKEYLQGLFLEKTKSERHTTFINGTVKEKYKLKHQGYGPIDDESQIMTLLMTYYEWLQEVNKSPYLNMNDYIMDVWVPEAIVFAYQKYFTYSKKKAWEMFFKGPRRTNEELQQMHNMIIEQANNMSPEDRQRFREREEEILRAAGIEPDYKPKTLSL